jgi:serine/threonine-protein kinase
MLMKRGKVKIMDFGIARMRASDLKTSTGVVLGTPRYMSPEQIQGKPLDRRTDIYSLGAVLYFLFTGVEPFVGKDVRDTMMTHLRGVTRAPRDLDPTLPPPLSDAILKALAVEPEGRFATADAFASALTRALETSAA